MPRNFNLNVWPPNNPGAIIRLCLGVLLAANLVAGYFVIWPIGGSPQQLRQQVQELNTQTRQKRGLLDRTRLLVGKIETGRGEGDKFMSTYFLPRRTAYSTIVSELADAAGKAKIKEKERAYAIEPVEGSDTLSLMQISANYEGAYADLVRFINLIDRSDRLLIIESLNATPQQGANGLNVMVKMDTLVREDGSGQ